MSEWGADGWAVPLDGGTKLDQGPDAWLNVLVRGRESADAMGVFYFHHPVIPENPPHQHPNFMKVILVLEGQYEFRVGDAEFEAGPGSLVVVPKGSQHAFTTSTGGQAFFVCSPFGELGPDATGEQMLAVTDKWGMIGLPGEAGRPWRPKTAQ
jgi:quercetin dioxygenase-like cupin family protein